jgi:phosphate:Na+ symporter
MQFDFWQLIAGLGLFLFAMRQLEDGLKALAGRSFKRWLQTHTDRPLKGIVAGTIATAFLQSSSLVGLMVLAFVGAGIMALENAIGVILGANLGTTLTGWLVAALGFKLELNDLALPLIGVGTIMLATIQGPLAKGARVLSALGFLLLGLAFMKDSVGSLGEHFDIARLADLSLWQYLLFGTVFAAIIQSSSATMMVTLAALFAGVIELPAAAALAIGADLGTTTTVIIGAAQGVPPRKRVALAHFIFNLATDLIAFTLLAPLLNAVKFVGISDPMYALVAFHSLFNLLGIALFFPFIGLFARFLNSRFKDTVHRESLFVGTTTPAVTDAAISAISDETAHLIARVVRQNMRVFSPPLPHPPGRLPVTGDYPIEGQNLPFDELYRKTKYLEGELLGFAVKIQAEPLESNESQRVNQLLSAVRDAVHSAKSLRDIRHDLEAFEDSPRRDVSEYLEHFRSVMTAFYGDLFRLRSDDESPALFQDFADLISKINNWHNQLHREIFADIKRGGIDEADISSLLNVNRELLNSNVALVMALADYSLDADAADAVRQLPGTA